MTTAELFETAKLLPLTPGVYIMHAKDDTVIYVGKSKALRNRVSSYFAPYAKHNVKTAHMAASVYRFEVYHTATELEALILENQFIKQYMPKYNIKLKDSKSYPYIELTGGDYPNLTVSYERIHDSSRYFGPYSSAGVAWTIITTARKSFRIPSCKKVFPHDIGKCRPCLNYHINQCMGVCIKDNISPEEYASVISDTVKFLRGDYSLLIKNLEARMETLSENLEFERAAKVRDTLISVKKLKDRQHIVADVNVTADVIGHYSDELGSAVTVFFVRNGAITDRECLFFGPDELFEPSAIVSMLCGFYTLGGFVPEDIYTDLELSESDTELFSKCLGGTNIVFPRKGEKLHLVEMACANARELILHKRETESRESKFAILLAEFLKLEVIPERIESFDVSNNGNENIVCGMAVWEKGRFVKKKYRSFTMKSVSSQDDYSSMREAIERRIEHRDGDWALPDLILLDGGEGHVSVIKELLAEKGMDIPVFGMIKDEHHKTRTLTDGENEIGLHKRQDIFNFMYRLQEEVHEAAFRAMDTKRRKTMKSSSLTEIPLVGEKTAEKLLKSFGGLNAIKQATEEEIIAKGIPKNIAHNVFLHFNQEKSQTKGDTE